ncbi:MAG: sensor histidine kinase [Rubripirellula sp.]
MQVLLIEPDQSQQSRWQERLKASDVQVTCVTDFSEAYATHGMNFGIVLCRWCDVFAAPNAGDNTLIKLQSLGQMMICIIDQLDDTSRDRAYEAGFCECLSVDCSEQQLTAKLRHADHLSRLDSRLAQAQKLESIGELAAGIAHEINTPIQYVGDNTRFVRDACEDLTTVLNCCQALIDSIQEDQQTEVAGKLRSAMEEADVDYLIEEIPAAISQSLEGVDRVANIVRAMKEFAHPGVSEMVMSDVSSLISNTVMVARNEWKYVAELNTEFDADLPQIPCLPGEVNQVLLNMIVNASHAIASSLGESPETKGTITISTHNTTNHAEIRIADSGSGISPENVEKIFNPFFTTKAAGKGTGQGLAIAQTVVEEKHGGEIKVESEVGKGTTFIIRLPLQQSAVEPAQV